MTTGGEVADVAGPPDGQRDHSVGAGLADHKLERDASGHGAVTDDVASAHHWRFGGRPWRSVFFAPMGDGTSRRKGSDIFRVILAIGSFVVCWAITHANVKLESSIESVFHSAPNGLQWVVNVIWYGLTFGLLALLAVLSLFAGRVRVFRDLAVAGVAAWLVTLGFQWLFGSTGGRPVDPSLQGIDLSFPVAAIAATVAVVFAALPYLSRSVQRLLQLMVVVVTIMATVRGSGMPTSVVASVALGWGVCAVMHLVFGSPLGLPSGDEVENLVAELGIVMADVVPFPRQSWGEAHYFGHDTNGRIDISLYGRDAADAQFVSKVGRFIFYRDSGPTLSLTRLQQIEHEAYLTLLAAQAGAQAPLVLAAGSIGPSRDAVLVTRPPHEQRLGDLLEAARLEAKAATRDAAGLNAPDLGTTSAALDTPASAAGEDTASPTRGDPDEPLSAPFVDEDPGFMDDGALDTLLGELAVLRAARIAHGAISPDTIVVGERSATLVDYRFATAGALDDRLDNDAAGALASMALAAGVARTVASAQRVMATDHLATALPHLQRAGLDPAASRMLRGKKPMLKALREQGAAAAGVETPDLDEPRRVSWPNLIMAVGTVIGGWALIAVLINVTKSLDTIKGAEWGWVALVFFLAQAAYPAEALAVLGSVLNPLPYGRALALEVANTFVALAGGTVAVLAARVRFFQQQGYSATLAVSSGVLVSTASWIVKTVLFLVALPFALHNLDFGAPTNNANHADLIWLVLIVVLVVAVALGLILAVPRLRRMARDKLRPPLAQVMAQLRSLALHPRKLVQVFGGSIIAQLVIALSLGASLHAFGQQLSLATLIVVITLASVLGGMSPVPGGMGVVEVGMILGLTAAGISETVAVAAVFVQRLFTAYLPPIWGWFVLAWMRRKDYV